MVTYNPTKDKVYALLKDQAKPDDILKAAFHVSSCLLCHNLGLRCVLVPNYPVFWQWRSIVQAHVLLHFINKTHERKRMNPDRSDHYGSLHPRSMDFLAHIAESSKIVSSSYGTFRKKAKEQVTLLFFVINVLSTFHRLDIIVTSLTCYMTNHIPFRSVPGLDNVRIAP
jgi:hypothetical protein